MSVKDYYKILDVQQSADDREIKKAYRQKAMRFHPDRNQGNLLAEHQFREVLEAYEVLSDPRRRSAYNQQRWYRTNTRKEYDTAPVTPHNILQKCRALNRYIFSLDKIHINRNALNQYINQLLSAPAIEMLLLEDDRSTNREIVKEILKSAYVLPYPDIDKLGKRLIKLAGSDNETVESISKYTRERKLSAYWNKYLPVVVLLISLLLCLLIYLAV